LFFLRLFRGRPEIPSRDGMGVEGYEASVQRDTGSKLHLLRCTSSVTEWMVSSEERREEVGERVKKITVLA